MKKFLSIQKNLLHQEELLNHQCSKMKIKKIYRLQIIHKLEKNQIKIYKLKILITLLENIKRKWAY